jgi:hypothetical protein
VNDHQCATLCGRPAPEAELCRTCSDALCADLRTVGNRTTDSHGNPVRTLADELLVTLTRGNRTTNARVGGRSATTPLPWHEAAGDTVRRLRSALGTWASRLHLLYSPKLPDPTDPTGWFQPPPDFTADVESLAAWLLRHPTWMAQHPDAAELFIDITGVIGEAWRIIDRVPDRWYAGPCSVKDCAGQVFGDPGGPVGSCTACGNTYDMVQRRAFLLDAARDYVLTAAELSRALPVLLGITIGRKTITDGPCTGWGTWKTRC